MILDTKQLCEDLKISRATLYRYRQIGLPTIQVNKKLMFDKEEVIKWLKDNSKS